MQASMFFRTLFEGRKIHHRDRALYMSDMCDAVTIALDGQNYKTFKNKFIDRALNIGKKKSNTRKALPSDDVRTAQIVGSAMQAVSQFMGRLN